MWHVRLIPCSLTSANVPTPNAFENMSALNANARPFSIRSNAFRILVIAPAVCCQPTSLFLTTSQAGGIAMIPPLVSNDLEFTLDHLCGIARNLRDLQPKRVPNNMITL